MLSLSDLCQNLPGVQPAYPCAGDLVFARVVHDSREVQPGDLFVALRGQRDGHTFIPDAFQRGARGVLAERLVPLDPWLPAAARPGFAYLLVPATLPALQTLAAYWRRRFALPVVAITGSVGKTSTKEVLAAVLETVGPTLRSQRSFNNEIGVPLTLLGLRPEHRFAVLEMGTYGPGEIAALCRIAQPTIGVVTNVGPVHLERMGSLETIARAKAEIVADLPADGYAVLNGDDPRVRAMAGQTRARVVLYGLAAGNALRAEAIESRGLHGLRFELIAGPERRTITTPLIGRHLVYAALAAAAVGLCLGLSLDQIADGLARARVGLRLQPVPARNGALLLDDTYNASPASCRAALDLLAELPGRKVAILGDMYELGAYEEEGHREVGRYAAGRVDHLIVVGPRARWIGEEAEQAGLSSVEYYPDRQAVRFTPQPGDVILVKGSRGMRMEELVAALRAEASP